MASSAVAVAVAVTANASPVISSSAGAANKDWSPATPIEIILPTTLHQPPGEMVGEMTVAEDKGLTHKARKRPRQGEKDDGNGSLSQQDEMDALASLISLRSQESTPRTPGSPKTPNSIFKKEVRWQVTENDGAATLFFQGLNDGLNSYIKNGGSQGPVIPFPTNRCRHPPPTALLDTSKALARIQNPGLFLKGDSNNNGLFDPCYAQQPLVMQQDPSKLVPLAPDSAAASTSSKAKRTKLSRSVKSKAKGKTGCVSFSSSSPSSSSSFTYPMNVKETEALYTGSFGVGDASSAIVVAAEPPEFWSTDVLNSQQEDKSELSPSNDNGNESETKSQSVQYSDKGDTPPSDTSPSSRRNSINSSDLPSQQSVPGLRAGATTMDTDGSVFLTDVMMTCPIQFVIRFRTNFFPMYYRNDRKNVQCFPRCEEHGEYFSMRVKGLKHSTKRVCRAPVEVEVKSLCDPRRMLLTARFVSARLQDGKNPLSSSNLLGCQKCKSEILSISDDLTLGNLSLTPDGETSSTYKAQYSFLPDMGWHFKDSFEKIRGNLQRSVGGKKRERSDSVSSTSSITEEGSNRFFVEVCVYLDCGLAKGPSFPRQFHCICVALSKGFTVGNTRTAQRQIKKIKDESAKKKVSSFPGATDPYAAGTAT
jgi:hypothetical protein